MRFPLPLAPGARIRVVAPSGPFDADLLARGVARLSERYEVLLDVPPPELRDGYFAEGDEHRLARFQSALDAEDASAILLARGGYGLARLVPRLDFSRFLAAPRWFVGFSDGTVVHQALNSCGVASLHAPNGTTLANAAEEDLEALIAALEGRPALLRCTPAPEVAVEGPLLGGNLTVLFAEAASGRLAPARGALVLLEDVSETSYRVDRMLTALRDRGFFDGARGVLLGDFTDCSPGKFEVPVERVLEGLADLGIPVLRGLPVGHGDRNAPLVLGAWTRVDGARGVVGQTLEGPDSK